MIFTFVEDSIRISLSSIFAELSKKLTRLSVGFRVTINIASSHLKTQSKIISD